MRKFLIMLLIAISPSSFAQNAIQEMVVGIVAAYTPLEPAQIFFNDELMNCPIRDRFVAEEFFGNLNHDLVKKFGGCAHLALQGNISIVQLSYAITKQCDFKE